MLPSALVLLTPGSPEKVLFRSSKAAVDCRDNMLRCQLGLYSAVKEPVDISLSTQGEVTYFLRHAAESFPIPQWPVQSPLCSPARYADPPASGSHLKHGSEAICNAAA